MLTSFKRCRYLIPNEYLKDDILMSAKEPFTFLCLTYFDRPEGQCRHIITLVKNMSKSRKMSYNMIHCYLVGIVLLTKRKSDIYLLIILYEFKYSTVVWHNGNVTNSILNMSIFCPAMDSNLYFHYVFPQSHNWFALFKYLLGFHT